MDNKIMIVDEQTGRIMDGRYSDGYYTRLSKAKENVKIEAATQTFATAFTELFQNVQQTSWYDRNCGY
jgi:preprotein translocase subunit SecA